MCYDTPHTLRDVYMQVFHLAQAEIMNLIIAILCAAEQTMCPEPLGQKNRPMQM